MTESNQSQLHIVFLVDTTGSMNQYIIALKNALQQTNALLRLLFPSDADVSIISYEDYCDGPNLMKSKMKSTCEDISEYCASLKAGGGGDEPEASKTALNALYDHLKSWGKHETTIVLHYTDAPPHHKITGSSARHTGPGLGHYSSNRQAEEAALSGKYPGSDWVKISKAYRSASSRVRIFTILPRNKKIASVFYCMLGEVILLNNITSKAIVDASMAILLQLIGCDSESSLTKFEFQDMDKILEEITNEEVCSEDNFPLLVSVSKAGNVPGIISDLYKFNSIPQIVRDVTTLERRFKTDNRFRTLVFEVMEYLVVPQNVMALTTNMIFGKLWRLVCTRRDDDRTHELVVKMGDCGSSNLLGEGDRKHLRAWIELSYDNREEINNSIRSHTSGCQRYYVMGAIPDSEGALDVNDLRSLARAPSPKALSTIQKMLSNMSLELRREDERVPIDQEENLIYLPETLSDREFFSMLPHLIHPGTSFSLKPSAMLAILCCNNSGSLLESRARRFLKSIVGKWIPPVQKIDRAEIISYEFSALVASCPKEALTNEERRFFDRLHEIWRFRRGRFSTFEVTTPLILKKPTILLDTKETCKKCNEWTSTTLLAPNKMCGICLWENESPNNSWTRPATGEDYYVGKNESYMINCTTCQARYAIIGPGDLNVSPKCHFCRGLDSRRSLHEGAPSRECIRCRAKYCIPSSVSEKYSSKKKYLCPLCQNDYKQDKVIANHSVELNCIIKENPSWVTRLGLQKKAAGLIFSGKKIHEAVVNDRECLFNLPPTEKETPPLMHKGYYVLNENQVLNNVKESIANASFIGTCQLCYEECSVEKLRPACGNCPNRCCVSCLTVWYQLNRPGRIFLPSHDMCPFCRKRPKFSVLNQYNHEACGIIGLSRRKGKQLSLRADYYYGWCTDCWRVSYLMDRNCGDGQNLPSVTEFRCDECLERKLVQEQKNEDATKLMLKNSKHCPGCTILTTHLGGCSHMTCVKCGSHWCWQCGDFKADSSGLVYQHLNEFHGGYSWIGDEINEGNE